MAESSNKEEIIYQNLIDAGCNEELAKLCMALVKEGKREDVLHFLSSHKDKLLDTVHINQKRIDCLDFLIYKIEKKKY